MIRAPPLGGRAPAVRWWVVCCFIVIGPVCLPGWAPRRTTTSAPATPMPAHFGVRACASEESPLAELVKEYNGEPASAMRWLRNPQRYQRTAELKASVARSESDIRWYQA